MAEQFKLYTGILKAWQDEATNKRFVKGTLSSTVRDRVGDEITEEAEASMVKTAIDNMTIWLNHDYTVPSSLFGSCVAASTAKRMDAKQGACTDMDIVVEVCEEDENPDASKTWRAIKNGRKLGFSIGANVTKHSIKAGPEKGTSTFVIEGIELLEGSVVGIPAQQRAYIVNAVKSLKGIPETPSEAAIPLNVEAKGAGDKLRASILRNEERAAERIKEIVAPSPLAGDESSDELVPAPVANPVAEMEAALAAPVAPNAQLALELEPAEPAVTPAEVPAAVEPSPAEIDAALAPIVIELTPADIVAEPVAEPVETAEPIVAGTTPAKPKGWVEGPTDDATSMAYILENILWLLGQEIDSGQATVLSEMVALITQYINSEAAEAASGPVTAAVLPMLTKALDAAGSSAGKVAGLTTELTQLRAEKAQVEKALGESVALIEQLLTVPVGRKSMVVSIAKAAEHEYPWLSPVIQKALASTPGVTSKE